MSGEPLVQVCFSTNYDISSADSEQHPAVNQWSQLSSVNYCTITWCTVCVLHMHTTVGCFSIARRMPHVG